MNKKTIPSPKFPLSEVVKSIPEVLGIRVNEEPEYTVLKKFGNIEVRRYKAQLHAQLTLSDKNFDSFREKAFKILANYIFGGNQSKRNIAMTSPVLQKKSSDSSETIAMTSPVLQKKNSDGQWTMSFILPAKFNLKNAPSPDDQQVKLKEEPGFDAVTLRYSGNNNLEVQKEKEQELKKWLDQNPNYKAKSEPFTAQYDAPFVVPFFKRNEIFVKIE
jgi:SOUL heme-binding protein